MRGLYIHLPFCNAKCPYCGFYSVTNFDTSLLNAYTNACIDQIKSYANNTFDTIYIGGGTPSALPVKTLENFILNVLNNINYTGAEFTIEANPESVTDDFISFVKSSNISRVSLGIQSFNDDVLKLLGRLHNSKQAMSVAEKLIATDKGINLDMIFDIPNVDKSTIFDTANIFKALSPAHVSAYSYTSKDTNYLEDIDPDESQFEEIENFFNSNGIFKYETSNFAKPTHESKHNILYWTMQEYIGIGASSHSMQYHEGDKYIRYSKPVDINEYIKNFHNNDEYDILTNDIGLKEAITLGLRMVQGVDMLDVTKRYGKLPPSLVQAIDTLIAKNMLESNHNHLKATTQGALVLENLSAYLWNT